MIMGVAGAVPAGGTFNYAGGMVDVTTARGAPNKIPKVVGGFTWTPPVISGISLHMMIRRRDRTRELSLFPMEYEQAVTGGRGER